MPDDALECPRCATEIVGSASDARIVSQRTTPDGSARREATILFCDLGGYTAWNEEEEPEEVAVVLDRIKRRAIHTLEAHGGIANQFVGDEVLGLFGVASSHEDDPCRAVAAALSLHAFVREQRAFRANGEPRHLRLHSGIETGIVFARIRDPRSGLYEINGDPVNTAARLRSIAAPDEIVVGPETRQRIEPFYRLVALADRTLRGKAQPIALYRVVGSSSTTSFFDAARARGLVEYVGRTPELTVLRHAWEQARVAAAGGIITIAGAPGVGKTRLVHEFRKDVATGLPPGAWVESAASSAEPLILHGRCASYGNVPPYQPFIDALTRFVEREGVEHGDLVARLATIGDLSDVTLRVLAYLLAPDASRHLLPAGAGGAPLRDAIVEALTELLIGGSRKQPILLAFDDWHGADEASRAALRHIAPGLLTARVLVVVNYRSGELFEPVRSSVVAQVELMPLDQDATEAMARRALDAPHLPRGLAAFIHERTFGNPFFVEEICRSLAETGAFVQRSGALALSQSLSDLKTPATVQAMVRARVDRLPVAQLRVLRVAAVFGAEFRFDLLKEVMAVPFDGTLGAPTDVELRTLLDGLEDQGLIYLASSAPLVHRFKHTITREVVYDGLPLHERRAYHGQVAELVEVRLAAENPEAQYETLAHHYRLSVRFDKAIDYAILAAEKAWRSFSLEQADRQYARAVGLVDRSRPGDADKRRRIDVTLGWARVGVYNPHADLVRELRVALEWARELDLTRSACLCLNWLSWIQYALGNHEAALDYGLKFLESARALGDAKLVAQALTNLGLSQTIAVRYDEASASIDAGIQTRARFTGTAYGYALGSLAMIHGDRGDFESARLCIERATPGVTGVERLSLRGPLLVQRGMVEAWQGHWEACIQTAGEVRAIAERIDGRYLLAMSLSLEGFARSLAAPGDPGAIAQLREAVSLLEAWRIRLHLSWSYALLAEALLGAGDDDAALAAVDRALERVREQDRLGECAALRVSAMAFVRRDGDHARAAACLDQALHAAEAKGSKREVAHTQQTRGALLIVAGEAAEGEALVREAALAFDAMQMPLFAGAARRSLATLAG